MSIGGVLPEARNDDLVLQELPDELLVYDQRRHKAHCLNKTAAFVWKRCDGRTEPRQIAREMEAAFHTKVDESVVLLALKQLDKNRLLKDGCAMNPGSGLTRRDVIKRIGVAAAVALPLVTSIIAPTATQAATCLPSGSACTSSAQCCSGICTSNTCV